MSNFGSFAVCFLTADGATIEECENEPVEKYAPCNRIIDGNTHEILYVTQYNDLLGISEKFLSIPWDIRKHCYIDYAREV